jgi:hypothetical protein
MLPPAWPLRNQPWDRVDKQAIGFGSAVHSSVLFRFLGPRHSVPMLTESILHMHRHDGVYSVIVGCLNALSRHRTTPKSLVDALLRSSGYFFLGYFPLDFARVCCFCYCSNVARFSRVRMCVRVREYSLRQPHPILLFSNCLSATTHPK